MSSITVVGAGVVGSATGIGLEDAGHDVRFVDIDGAKVAALGADGHKASTAIELPADQGAFICLTLPTPTDGLRWDLSAFKSGVRAVGRAMRETTAFHTVVVRSTVPPGTSRNIVQPLLEAESRGQAGLDFSIASAPEFLRAATAVEDFKHPWVTVIASESRRTVERLVDLLGPFGGTMLTYGDPTVAELIKCAHNNYNATKISFFNELWLVAEKLSVDHAVVASAIAASAEASFNPIYGIEGGRPYGGACLPKDTKGFLGFAEELGVELPILEATVEVNARMESLTDTGMGAGRVIDLSNTTASARSRRGGIRA